jgi:hypothetical protein
VLRLLKCIHPAYEAGNVTVGAAIVVALLLTLGAAAVVQLSTGSLRGMFGSSDTRQARGAAAEGIELVISTWNQPGNRALLVSGQNPVGLAPSDSSLANPCKTLGPAQPTQAAIDLADGSWRDVVAGTRAAGATDGRQFRLLGISYAAAPPGNVQPNPYTLRRSFGAAGSDDAALPPPSPAPCGPPISISDWRDLVNLQPVLGANLPCPQLYPPGSYTGFLSLIVEGREVRNGRVVANSRLTQEFEVLPKCCDCSLGSGGAVSLGADQRCNPSTTQIPAPPPSGVCPLGKSNPVLSWVAPEDWVTRGPTSSRLW